MTDKQQKTIQELQKAIEEADALAQQKSNFLATMSHEIRTPMQTIYGLLELIAAEKPSENVTSMVKTAQGAASGLLEILDDVLDMAKMDANAMELDQFEVPVRMLVRGMLEALSVKVRGAHVSLIDDIDEDVPFVVSGDPKRLRQILMNLCGNALKFTHEGSVTVRVTTNIQNIELEKNALGLRFEIIDTGIGMSNDVCDKLFQSFTQADNTTSRKYGGTGLGLSISKKLVELMGGAIGVTSFEGIGSTFWFEIPTQEISTDSSSVDLPNLEGISVLSVEDHPQGAKEIINSLRSMGAKVESCNSYAQGKELALQHRYDVAIIDQGLPDGLGIDLIKELGELRPYMGMVMYTVRDDVGLAHSLNSLGALYLTKPASRIGLGEAVQKAARNTSVLIEGPTRLLIAEDTDSVRDILSRQLKILGVEADFVHDGRQALEAYETGKYGIIITDLHMPNIDGYEVASTIRLVEETSGKRMPIIVLTADVQMAQREAFMRHGFDECLLKPVTLGQLKRLLIRWNLLLENSETAQEVLEIEATPEKDDLTKNPYIAINRDCLIANIGEINEGTLEMMHMFIDMTSPLIENIKTAYENGDKDQLCELGHSLKGSARSACCISLGELAARLQNEAKDVPDCAELLSEIYKEFDVVCSEIKSMQPED